MTELFKPYIVSREDGEGSVEIGIKKGKTTIPTRFVFNEELFRKLRIGVATVQAVGLARRLNSVKRIDAR
jgi:hypothetical protein